LKVPSFSSGGWKVFTAKVPSIEQFLQPFEDEMEHVVDLLEKKFDSSVATFAHKPVFERGTGTVSSTSIAQIIGSVSTDDEVYGYLNYGTSVRYATMTKGFAAKTKPGRISARAGSGGLAYVSKRRRRPGIKARNFDFLIAKGIERNVFLAAYRAVKKVRSMSGHAI
jgi:hypothetical protein